MLVEVWAILPLGIVNSQSGSNDSDGIWLDDWYRCFFNLFKSLWKKRQRDNEKKCQYSKFYGNCTFNCHNCFGNNISRLNVVFFFGLLKEILNMITNIYSIF